MSPRFRSAPLACPLDGLALQLDNRQFCCESGHCFDLAKQGYINLLPVQFKSSQDPGDSKAMVNARRCVMEKNYFETVADTLCDNIVSLNGTNPASNDCILDAGCGEGFFTHKIQQRILALSNDKNESTPNQVIGIDISKWAITASAKRYTNIAFAVANNTHPPVLKNKAPIITSLFGFASWPAWAALQAQGQYVITVDAGPRHLLELRQCIYPEVRVHAVPAHTEAAINGYQLTLEKSVSYVVSINNPEDLMAILDMTPHGRKITKDAREKLFDSNLNSLSIDVAIRCYRLG